AAWLRTGRGLAQGAPGGAPDPDFPGDPVAMLDEQGARTIRQRLVIRTTGCITETTAAAPMSARSWHPIRWDRLHLRPLGASSMTQETTPYASVDACCARVAPCPCPSESVRTSPNPVGRARVALGPTQEQLGEMFHTSMRTAHRYRPDNGRGVS